MRNAWVLVAMLGCSSPATPREVYITIGADALATAQQAAHGYGLQVVEQDGDVAVLSIDPAHLDELSDQMHAQHHRCGGFMVHESLADARAAARPERTIDYTLDRGELVTRVLPHVEAARIEATIRELSAMKNRYYQSASGAAASVWLRDRWRSLTTRSDVTIELVDHGYEQKSVVMTIPGTTRPAEVIVIGGHLDSIAPGGFSANAPGADDDASGVATLTEVARVLLASDFRPERTIKFMAYAAEEVGLRGSLSIAKDYQKRKIDVVGALQLDMTNYQGSPKDIWLINDFTSAAQNNFLVSLIETYVGASWGWDKCGYACSDHASWHRAGVPASMPFEARFRDSNQAIHTARDTLERSQNTAEHAAKFARLATAYAIELAKGDVGGKLAVTTKRDDDHPWRWIAGFAALAIAISMWRRTARAA